MQVALLALIEENDWGKRVWEVFLLWWKRGDYCIFLLAYVIFF